MNTRDNYLKFLCHNVGNSFVYQYSDGSYSLSSVITPTYLNLWYDEKVIYSHPIVEKRTLVNISDDELKSFGKIIYQETMSRGVFEFEFERNNSSIYIELIQTYHHIKSAYPKTESRGFIDVLKIFSKKDTFYNIKSYIVIQSFQYLYFKNFALEWNGISVEKQLEYNWIKL